MHAWPLWTSFVAFVLIMMVLDLRVVSKPGQPVPIRRAVAWTGVCVALALAFVPVLIWLYDTHRFGIGDSADPTKILTGKRAAAIFLQGWVLEYSLSVDNLFVFAVIFQSFRVPPERQHRVLAWGIIAALILRGVMIGLGAVLFSRFAILIPIAGAFLLFTALTMLRGKESEFDAQGHWSTRLLKKILPYDDRIQGDAFFVRQGTRWAMTPLLLVLIVLNIADVIFALDSIPVIFGITTDPFLVFTSNVFAILGLRSLYFALAALMGRFDRLTYALAFILAFIGVKMILGYHGLPKGLQFHINEYVSLAVIGGSLLIGVLASLVAKPKPAAHGGTP